MHDLPLSWVLPAAVATLAWLPGTSRRLGGLGTLLIMGGAASLAVAAGDHGALDPLRVAALPGASTATDAGAVALGCALLGWASMPVAVRGPGSARLAAGVLLAAAVLAVIAGVPVLRAASGPRVAAAAVAIVVVGGALMAAAAAGRERYARSTGAAASDPGTEERDANAPRPGRRRALLLVAAAAAIWLPGAIGVLAAALAAMMVLVPGGRWTARLAMIMAGIGLVGFGWLASTIAGPVGLSVRALPDAPFSTAAQSMLIVALAAGAYPYFGMWPFHRLREPLLTLIGVALLVRLAAPALPEGLAAWQTVLVPIGVAALWHAAWSRRLTAMIGAAAWLACCALPSQAAAAGAWALGLAAGATILRGSPAFRDRAAGTAALALVLALAAWGGVRAWPALLETQVVYGVLVAVGLALGVTLVTVSGPSGALPRAQVSGD